MVDFGKRLKELRNKSNMTQTELAAKLGITKSVVSYYELQERTPSPEVLVKLSKIFHVSADYLLGIDSLKTIDVSALSDADVGLVVSLIERLSKK